jgi:hypothetical protein
MPLGSGSLEKAYSQTSRALENQGKRARHSTTNERLAEQISKHQGAYIKRACASSWICSQAHSHAKESFHDPLRVCALSLKRLTHYNMSRQIQIWMFDLILKNQNWPGIQHLNYSTLNSPFCIHLISFLSRTLDLILSFLSLWIYLSCRDESAADQPNNLAEGLPPLYWTKIGLYYEARITVYNWNMG